MCTEKLALSCHGNQVVWSQLLLRSGNLSMENQVFVQNNSVLISMTFGGGSGEWVEAFMLCSDIVTDILCLSFMHDDRGGEVDSYQ